MQGMLSSRRQLGHNQSGFTLVEMALVLGTIGILVGAIVSGQHLLHTLKLKKIEEDHQFYQAAIQQFTDRFRALPGDMRNATSYWGQIAGTAACLTPTSAAGGNGVGTGTGTATCNGNGDRIIANVDQAQLFHEMFRAWQHLSNADLLEARFTGVNTGSNAAQHTCPTNCPAGSFKNSGWAVLNFANLTGDGGSTNAAFNRTLGNVLGFGLNYADNPPLGPILTPQEARELDQKYDDTSPVTGNITAVLGQSAGTSPVAPCTTANDDSDDLTATYSTTTDTVSCALYFVLSPDVRGPQ